MTHKPIIYWNWNSPPVSARNTVLETFAKLRKRLEETSPDVIIVVANDHLDQFFVGNMPSFCVGISSRAEGPFPIESKLGIPTYRTAVAEDLAKHLLKEGIRNELDFARISNFRLDHAFVVPLSFVSPKGEVPIVPVYANTLVPPVPEINRFHYLGKIIARAVESYIGNSSSKVAVVGSLNLSVEVAAPKQGSRDEEFDTLALEIMQSGSAEEFLKRLSLDRIFSSGNASAESLIYLSLLGAAGDKKPASIECPIVPRWGTCPSVAWELK
jgi:protocatechuate 4,5-dioxygenase beta chain